MLRGDSTGRRSARRRWNKCANALREADQNTDESIKQSHHGLVGLHSITLSFEAHRKPLRALEERVIYSRDKTPQAILGDL